MSTYLLAASLGVPIGAILWGQMLGWLGPELSLLLTGLVLAAAVVLFARSGVSAKARSSA